MTLTANENAAYFFIVHGVPPEFFPGVAFRRAGRFEDERRKAIRCPYCAKYLTSIGASIKIELYPYPRKSQVSCHEYRRCNACRETVDIIFA